MRPFLFAGSTKNFFLFFFIYASFANVGVTAMMLKACVPVLQRPRWYPLIPSVLEGAPCSDPT